MSTCSCKVCNGQRYNRETLEVKYKGKNIDDVLNMTVNMARGVFREHPEDPPEAPSHSGCRPRLPARSDSPARRFRAARASASSSRPSLSKRDTGRTLYILDEPTTGLHFEDIRLLLEVLNKLVDRGNTVHRHRTQPRCHQGRRPYYRYRSRGRGGRRGRSSSRARRTRWRSARAATRVSSSKSWGCSVSVCPAGRSAVRL